MASVIQTAQGSATSLYGIATTAISTREGSWLALLAGWNTGTPGTDVSVPAVAVTDSAGNLWRQAGMTAAGSSATRCAVWVAPNALPVSWVSAGLTGFAAAASWTVAEISGMPQAASVDFSIGTSGQGTAASLTGIASETDVAFAIVAAGNGGAAVTTPAGWAALGTAQAGTGTQGVTSVAYWNAAVTAGTATTAAGLSPSSKYSYALCALSASASPPPQANVNFPLVQVEAAFDAMPGNISTSLDYLASPEFASWTDITTRAIGPAVTGRIKCSRGRQYQLQQEETGTCTVPLSNVDGAFTPTAPGSPYYSSALNANMSFQSGISGWSPSTTAALASSSAFSYASGLNAVAQLSMQVTPNAGHSGAMAATVTVNPNYPYSGSAWMLSPGGYGTGGHIQVNWYTSGGTFISTSTGPNIPLPAGVWTFVSFTDITPPSGAGLASLIVSLNGSPTSANVFYVAEAALVTGPATVQTGLVTPITPIRVTAWWQGRRYPVWQGYAQAWPQEWPDMPQWGFAGLKAADALAVAAAGQMQSALIGEVLIDNPYAYLPCNESYTTQVNGATPANPFIFNGGYLQPTDANGLAAINRASGNQITGTYLDGTTVQVSTGLAMNFLGDSGTGMGATGYSAQVNGQRGPSMVYADPGLTNAFATLEFWFNWDGTSPQQVTLLAAYGPPSSFWNNVAGNASGSFLTAYASGSALTVTAGGGPTVTVPLTPSQSPQHAVILITGISPAFEVYLNGVFASTAPGVLSVGTVNAVVLGPGRYSYDCNNSPSYFAYNVAAGHLAIYPYLLSAARIAAHYQAGAAGWQGTDAGMRFSQILTWGQLGLKRGGYNAATATGVAEITQISPAYSLSGQPANSAVFNLSQSEGGQYRTQANGAIIYLERPVGYNLPVSAVLADGTAGAPVVLNTDPGFATGLAGWAASSGTVTYSPGNGYGGLGSLLVTPSGTATVTSPAFTYNGGSAAAGFWVNSPSGGTVSCGLSAGAGGGTVTAGLSAGAWTFLPVTAPATAGISSGSLFATGGTAPFYVAYAAAWYSPGNVPYQPKSSYGFDQEYLYNEVTATQQDGPNQLVLYDARGTASQAQFFRRSALTLNPGVISPYDVSDITTWSLAEYQEPSLRAATVTVDAASNPLGAFTTVLTLDQGQVAQVNRAPVGGAPILETGLTQRVAHDIGAGFWQASYQVSPYGPGQAVLCADTPGFSAPGTIPTLIAAW